MGVAGRWVIGGEKTFLDARRYGRCAVVARRIAPRIRRKSGGSLVDWNLYRRLERDHVDIANNVARSVAAVVAGRTTNCFHAQPGKRRRARLASRSAKFGVVIVDR